MKFTKQLTINIGNYESVRLGVEAADSFTVCDNAILAEIERMGLTVSNKIKECLNVDK